MNKKTFNLPWPSTNAKNVDVEMTRRYPKLKQKVLKRDSDITKKLMKAWDEEKDIDKTLSTYLKECKFLSDERYWELMRTVWILCGSVQNAGKFRVLMKSTRKNKYYFSTPEEAKALREMPEMFEVYRATNDENDGGISWTTSKEYAEQYKASFNKEKIISRTINRADVFAFVNRNKESEIILL